jgi:hypothetical protein
MTCLIAAEQPRDALRQRLQHAALLGLRGVGAGGGR